MWPNLQETVDLVTITEEILNENFIFCAVKGTSPNFLLGEFCGMFYKSFL